MEEGPRKHKLHLLKAPSSSSSRSFIVPASKLLLSSSWLILLLRNSECGLETVVKPQREFLGQRAHTAELLTPAEKQVPLQLPSHRLCPYEMTYTEGQNNSPRQT